MAKKSAVTISKEMVNLIKVLRKAADYAAEHKGELGKQNQKAVQQACSDFVKQLTQEDLFLDLSFYEKVADLLEEVVFLRALSIKHNIQNDALLKAISEIIAEVYAVVYDNEAVRKICVTNEHIAKKLARFKTVKDTEQLVGNMFHKIILLEDAAMKAENRMEALITALEKSQDNKKKTVPEDKKEEFVEVTFASYALNAAVELAMEELGVVKNHFRKLILSQVD